jgi:formyl-CoA transferase
VGSVSDQVTTRPLGGQDGRWHDDKADEPTTERRRRDLQAALGTAAKQGPLAGAIVLDFTYNMAGPYCTMLLSDLGATVVKIEPPEGEPHRWLSASPSAPMGAPWALVNRDKASVALDLKSEATREGPLRSLIQVADIIVHNFRPGVDTRLGIDAERVRSLNPHAIYCMISGFGVSERDRPGVDIVAEAFSGVASVTGEDASGPTKIGVPLFDVGAGLFALIEILGRWIARSRGGDDAADCTLVDAGVAFGTFNLAKAAVGGSPGYRGKDHELVAPYGYFQARDSWLALGCPTQGHWDALCRALGRPGLLEDPRFLLNPDRMEHRAALRAEIEAALGERDAFAWETVITDVGVPCAAVRNYGQVLQSELLTRRGIIAPVDDPWLGSFVRLLPLSYGRGEEHRPGQPLGADTAAVLGALTDTEPSEGDA